LVAQIIASANLIASTILDIPWWAQPKGKSGKEETRFPARGATK
jgi:hypothetical protein